MGLLLAIQSKLRRILLAGILAGLGAIGLIYLIDGPQLKPWETTCVMFILVAVGYSSGFLIYLTIRRKENHKTELQNH